MFRPITLRRTLILAAVCSTFLLSACTSEPQVSTVQTSSTENPTAAEWLQSEPDASLFQYEDTLYVADVSWINELELTRGDHLTDVLRQNKDGASFQNGDANLLEKATPIYRTKERNDILIVSTSTGDIRFLRLVEG
ncbi:hypothetical protein [Saccharibacillus sacchari]|uniref:Uncharacterized protein n=1 Tax=Saccharibacillus sacchari TaxID=456493 RepID=A0ACC6P773_9BACL